MSFREKVYAPTLALLIICAVMSTLMAGVYNTTKLSIENRAVELANEARRSVLPNSDSFEKVDIENLPDGVQEVFRSENGSGFVVTASGKGYGGNVFFMIGFSPELEVSGINMFRHNETPGLGTKVMDPSYLERYYGKVDESSVDALTGATLTSNALKNALRSAKEAIALVEVE